METPPTTCARPNSSYAARLNKSLRCDWKAPQFGTNPHLEGKSGRCFWWVSPLPLKRDPWIVWAEKQGVFWCRYTYRYIHVYVYIYLRWYVYSHIYIYIQLAGFHAINASMVILRMAMMAWQHGHPNPAKDFTQYLHGVSKSLPLNRNIMPPTMNLDKLLHIFFIDSPTEIYKQITNPYL